MLLKCGPQVVLGRYKEVHHVAIKIFEKVSLSNVSLDVLKEAIVMGACLHPNIVQVAPCAMNSYTP